MRKLVLAFAALAVLGLAVPATSTDAAAQTVVIKKGHGYNHGGWRRSHARPTRLLSSRSAATTITDVVTICAKSVQLQMKAPVPGAFFVGRAHPIDG